MPAFCAGDLDLVCHRVDAVEVRQQQAAPPVGRDDHAADARVEVLDRGGFGGLQDVDRDLEVGELVCSERREARVGRGRLDGVVDDLLGERGLRWGDRADAAAQHAAAVEADERAVPRREQPFGGRGGDDAALTDVHLDGVPREGDRLGLLGPGHAALRGPRRACRGSRAVRELRRWR